ncbi:MAG: methyltransferase domain-containing protein [Lewinellaceae bacterium]|nr:methyltransferase domain-containing protein [Lewinellaceae bacterium]
MPAADQEKWDTRYRERGAEAFGTAPSDWLVQQMDWLLPLRPGPVLDLACGNGRNGLYLARQGFDVVALDISPVIISWLRQRATEEGLSLRAEVVDLTTWDPGPEIFAIILNFNFLERDLFPVMQKVLRPGGYLLFETYTIEQAMLAEARQPRYPLKGNELLHAFPNLLVRQYREGIFHESGKGRRRAVASLLAEKPAALTVMD